MLTSLFPDLLLTPRVEEKEEDDAEAFPSSSSSSSPSSSTVPLGLLRVVDEAQLTTLMAFKKPSLEMFAVGRLLYLFVRLYRDCGCHQWTDERRARIMRVSIMAQLRKSPTEGFLAKPALFNGTRPGTKERGRLRSREMSPDKVVQFCFSILQCTRFC